MTVSYRSCAMHTVYIHNKIFCFFSWRNSKFPSERQKRSLLTSSCHMNSDKSDNTDKRDATTSSSSSDDNSNSSENDNSTKESNRSSSSSSNIPPNMTEEEEKSYALVTEKFFSFSQDKNKESFQAGYRELKHIFFLFGQIAED
jgi:hypothetical protein